MSAADLASLHAAIAEAADRLGAENAHVSCTRTIYVPSQGRWIAVFEAEAADFVHRAARIAQLPPGEVVQAVEMTVTSER